MGVAILDKMETEERTSQIMTNASLLAVFAHPDDETFRCGGTLALLAQRGVRVQVLTATRGQAGSCGAPPLCAPEELPAVRENELRCACAALRSSRRFFSTTRTVKFQKPTLKGSFLKFWQSFMKYAQK